MDLWKKFTGQKKYEEAYSSYNALSEKYRTRQAQYSQDVQGLSLAIADQVEMINAHKKKIQLVLFAELVEKLSFLKDIEIPSELQEEVYKRQCKKIDEFTAIQTKDELFKVDFSDKKTVSTLLAIITLGFATRKKAKESFLNVQEESSIIAAEIKKMESEVEKLKACLESLCTIEHYFSSMINLFEKMLIYLDHAMNYVGFTAMRIAKRLLKGSISISILPERQQKELEATITLAKTLSKMVRTQIVMQAEKNNIKEYELRIKASYGKITANEYIVH